MDNSVTEMSLEISGEAISAVETKSLYEYADSSYGIQAKATGWISFDYAYADCTAWSFDGGYNSTRLYD